LVLGGRPVNTTEASDLREAISAQYPDALVKVEAQKDGGQIVISVEGDKDRSFKIDDDYLTSPIVRLLVGDWPPGKAKTPASV
jgi:hypothetical protein